MRRNWPSRVPPGETETWMPWSRAAWAKGAFVAAAAQQIALEPRLGQPGQHRCGAGTVIGVGRWQLKIEQQAIFVANGTQLNAFDQLAAVNAMYPARWCRAQRAAVHDDCERPSLAAGNAPVEGRSLPEPAPQPQPGPAGKRAVM